MEYKGIQYQLVRTANPTGWKWTILFDDKRTKTGQQADRVSPATMDRLGGKPMQVTSVSAS